MLQPVTICVSDQTIQPIKACQYLEWPFKLTVWKNSENSARIQRIKGGQEQGNSYHTLLLVEKEKGKNLLAKMLFLSCILLCTQGAEMYPVWFSVGSQDAVLFSCLRSLCLAFINTHTHKCHNSQSKHSVT